MPVIAANNCVSSLQAPLFASDTSLTLRVGEGARFPDPDQNVGEYFVITVQNGALFEIMHVSRRINDVMTVLRGQEGTQAQAFPNGSSVENRITAGTFNAISKDASDSRKLAATSAERAATALAQIGDTIRRSVVGVQVLVGSLHAVGFHARRPQNELDPSQGGNYVLERPMPQATGLVSDVQFDLYGNRLRMFEQGGTARGVYVDLTTAASGAGSALWHGGNFNPTSLAPTSFTMKREPAFTDVEQGAVMSWEAGSGGPGNTGGMRVDLYRNLLRFYTGAGGSRGFYLDLSTGAGGASSAIWHSNNFNPSDLRPTNFEVQAPLPPSNQGAGVSFMGGRQFSDVRGSMRWDVYGDLVRLFETGGGNRGFAFNIRDLAPGVGSTLWHSGNFNQNAVQASLTDHDTRIAAHDSTLTSLDNAVKEKLNKAGHERFDGALEFVSDAMMTVWHRLGAARVGVAIDSAGTFTMYESAQNLDGDTPRWASQQDGQFLARGSFGQMSDRRFKSDIAPISHALDTVKQLRGVTFFRDGSEKREMGVIADEVRPLVPEVVNEASSGVFGDGGDNPYLTVAYANLTALLIEAIKDISVRLDALETNRRP